MNANAKVKQTDSEVFELLITRHFKAPRSLVFEAWSSAEHLAQWLGPKDFTVTHCEWDFSIGGKYRACIRSPEGVDYWMYGTFREIQPEERMAFTFAWEEDGERGLQTMINITLTDEGPGTKMVFHQAPFMSISERDGHNSGWSECFDRLERFLQM